MKFYIFILLLVLIFCNNIEKKEKINLLNPEDEINSFFDDFINIIYNCSFEIDCILSQITDYLILYEEKFNILYYNLFISVECRKTFDRYLSRVVDSSIFDEICDYLCE